MNFSLHNLCAKNKIASCNINKIVCIIKHYWGYSSAGRATGSQSVGQEFDPP